MHLQRLIQLALEEDIGSGDITTKATVDPALQGKAHIIAKEPLVISGLDVVEQVFHTVDPDVRMTCEVKDGALVQAGTLLAKIQGRLASLLSAERTALNFLQHLSGIATLTKQYVDAVKGTKAVILDTRKTLPGFRELEKRAVRAGGGTNHRIGLFDRYLIKENHIAAAGGISAAIERVKKRRQSRVTLEVEVKTLEELQNALTQDVEMIMLDNMSVKKIAEAVKRADGKCKLEVSGNVTLETVRKIAETGVDFISIGAITHSARAVDITMLIE